MLTYYIEENEQVVLYDNDLEKLKATIEFMPQYAELQIKETDGFMLGISNEQGEIVGFKIGTQEEYDQEQEKKEQQRIQQLFMTRSDFFDGTIKAFKADEEKLLSAISTVLEGAALDEIELKIALNNFKNALHFYRSHPLFEILGGIKIPLTEGQTITISSEQWDKFFDETNKKNPLAFEALMTQKESSTDSLPTEVEQLSATDEDEKGVENV